MSNRYDTAPEVIDLTGPETSNTEREIYLVSDSDNELNPPPASRDGEPQKESSSKKRKRRKRFQKEPNGNALKEPENQKRKRGEPEEGEITGEARRKRSRSPSISSDNLFFIDTTPNALASRSTMTIEARAPAPASNDLLLPSHVSVFGEAPVEILPATPLDSGDEDFIEFIDTDDRKDMIRYFDEPEAEEVAASNKRRIICRRCHEEGHMQAECKTQVCLTCGARNEHSTYACPVNKVCFNCGMKGHLSSQCQQARGYAKRNFAGCYLCDDDSHQSNECPSLWRIYNYVSKEERISFLDGRKSKIGLKLGEGGEGYIATDEWCYNCGESGHWGDDCQAQHPRDHPHEHSAFGLFNVNRGPFAKEDPGNAASRFSTKRELRDWERGSYLPEDWGAGAPTSVGKLGRKKERDKLARRHQQNTDDADEEGDFFSRLSKQGSALTIKGSAKKVNGEKPSKFKMTLSNNSFPPPSQSNSLLSRIDMGNRDSGRHSTNQPTSNKPRRCEPSPKDRDRGWGRDKDRNRDRDRDYRGDRGRDRDSDRRGYERNDKQHNDFRPRYKGGYSR